MIIDISLPIENNMQQHPSAYLSKVSLKPLAEHLTHKRSVQELSFATHVSTHIDAPFHAIPEGLTVDKIGIDQLCGKAIILNIKDKSYFNPISVTDLEVFENNLSKYKKIIFNTGWSDTKWGKKEYFLGGPFLTRDAAIYLKKFQHDLVAIDFPNIDSPEDTKVGIQNPNHAILLSNGTVLLENIINIKSAISDIVNIYCLPIKLVNGDGCPCRAIIEINT